MFNNVQPDVPVPSPTISASRKRQRTSQPVPSLSLDAPSPGLQSQPVVAPMQPSSSAAKRGTATAAKGKKPKSVSYWAYDNAYSYLFLRIVCYLDMYTIVFY